VESLIPTKGLIIVVSSVTVVECASIH